MFYIIKSRQRKGKTTVAVAICEWLIKTGQYKPGEIYSLVRLTEPDGRELQGYHFMGIREMRDFVAHMIERGYKHVILLIDEIDRVFPHRFWNKMGQTEALLGLWQDEKLGYIIIGTCHVGKSIDKILRDCAQMIIIAKINYDRTVIALKLIDVLNKRLLKRRLVNVRHIQDLFNTWQPVKY